MIKIDKLEKIFEDNRGVSLVIPNDRGGDFMIAYRKANTSSGRHYHTGKSKYKDPEIMYLLSGKVEMRWYRLDDKIMHKETVEAPARIEIPINIWHELWSLTDCSFWEMNSIEDVRNDSIRVEYE